MSREEKRDIRAIMNASSDRINKRRERNRNNGSGYSGRDSDNVSGMRDTRMRDLSKMDRKISEGRKNKHVRISNSFYKQFDKKQKDSLRDIVAIAPWLLEAKFHDAIISISEDKRGNLNICWHDGDWLDGVWEHGIWLDGLWLGGRWLDGVWHDGIWNDGIWENGSWLDGLWKSGIWLKGIWESGKWLGGSWIDGVWKSGIIDDEYSKYSPLELLGISNSDENGYWKDGRWEAGNFKDGSWEGGTWQTW